MKVCFFATFFTYDTIVLVKPQTQPFCGRKFMFVSFQLILTRKIVSTTNFLLRLADWYGVCCFFLCWALELNVSFRTLSMLCPEVVAMHAFEPTWVRVGNVTHIKCLNAHEWLPCWFLCMFGNRSKQINYFEWITHAPAVSVSVIMLLLC